jgi:hypothetical protein
VSTGRLSFGDEETVTGDSPCSAPGCHRSTQTNITEEDDITGDIEKDQSEMIYKEKNMSRYEHCACQQTGSGCLSTTCLHDKSLMEEQRKKKFVEIFPHEVTSFEKNLTKQLLQQIELEDQQRHQLTLKTQLHQLYQELDALHLMNERRQQLREHTKSRPKKSEQRHAVFIDPECNQLSSDNSNQHHQSITDQSSMQTTDSHSSVLLGKAPATTNQVSSLLPNHVNQCSPTGNWQSSTMKHDLGTANLTDISSDNDMKMSSLSHSQICSVAGQIEGPFTRPGDRVKSTKCGKKSPRRAVNVLDVKN